MDVDADGEGEDEGALMVAPTAARGVDELVLLLAVVCGRLLLCVAMLTCHGCCCDLVGVTVPLPRLPTCALAMAAMLSLLQCESSVVLVLLHDERELDDSLCLIASWGPEHDAGAVL